MKRNLFLTGPFLILTTLKSQKPILYHLLGTEFIDFSELPNNRPNMLKNTRRFRKLPQCNVNIYHVFHYPSLMNKFIATDQNSFGILYKTKVFFFNHYNIIHCTKLLNWNWNIVLKHFIRVNTYMSWGIFRTQRLL